MRLGARQRACVDCGATFNAPVYRARSGAEYTRPICCACAAKRIANLRAQRKRKTTSTTLAAVVEAREIIRADIMAAVIEVMARLRTCCPQCGVRRAVEMAEET